MLGQVPLQLVGRAHVLRRRLLQHLGVARDLLDQLCDVSYLRVRERPQLGLQGSLVDVGREHVADEAQHPRDPQLSRLDVLIVRGVEGVRVARGGSCGEVGHHAGGEHGAEDGVACGGCEAARGVDVFGELCGG